MSEELKKKEKEMIWSQDEDSEIWEKYNKNLTHDANVHISIPCKGLELEAIFQAEELLRKAGVIFDTGYGCGCRDWEFDWSLRGAFVKLVNKLDEQEQLENFFRRKLFDGYKMIDENTPNPDYLPCTILSDKHKNIHIVVHGTQEDRHPTLIRKLNKIGCKAVDLSDEKSDSNYSKCIFRYKDKTISVSYDNDWRY